MGIGDARSGSDVPRPAGSYPDPASTEASHAPEFGTPVRSGTDPYVLVIGADEAFVAALTERLGPHRFRVKIAPLEQALEAAVVTAPDLILLVGDAAQNSGRQLLAQLTSSPVSSVIPVALLGDGGALDARLRAFRYGAAAVIPRSGSIDTIAEHVAALAQDIPERAGEVLGEIDEADLPELVSTLSSELRSGILSIQGSNEPVRLVLGSGRPLAAFIDDFLSKVRQQVTDAEPLRYAFDDRPGGTVQLLSSETRDSEPPPSRITGVRILLADDDANRADVVAHALRARGATVAVTALSLTDAELHVLRQLDPQIVVVGEAELSGEGFRFLRRLKRDARLRWASLLVVRWDEMRDPTLSVPTADRITGPLAGLAEVDRGLFDRTELGDAFDARLEVNGPARCLRALAASARSLRVRIYNPRLNVELDLFDGLVAGVSATAPDGTFWEGAAALSALLMLSSGRVRVEPTGLPVETNLMVPIEKALSLADKELSPIAPSIAADEPPPSVPPPLPSGIPSSVPPPLPWVEQPSLPPAVDEVTTRLPVEALPASAFQHASTRPKRPRRVSKALTAFLVGLGILAGLGIAVFLRAVTRDPELGTSATAASVPEVQRSAAELSAENPNLAESATSPTPAAGLAAPSASVAVLPLSGAAAALDETGQRVSSCGELVTAVQPDSEDVPAAASEQLKRARKAMIAGKLEDAQRAYCTAARWDPNKALHHFELAHVLLLRRDGAAAAESAQKGIDLEPKSGRGESLLGDALARVGDAEGAQRAWFLASGVKSPGPRDAEQLAQRSIKEAEDALESRDHVRAERFFRRAALLDTKAAAGARGLSIALTKLGDSVNALIWARRAVERANTDPLSHLALGDALQSAGDKQGAREAWLEAERLGYPDARRRVTRLDEAR